MWSSVNLQKGYIPVMRLKSSIKKYISLRSKAENKRLMHCLWGNVGHNYLKRHTLPSYQDISLWFVGHAVFTHSPQISPFPSPLLGTLMFGRWCLADKHSCSTSQGCPSMSPTLDVSHDVAYLHLAEWQQMKMVGNKGIKVLWADRTGTGPDHTVCSDGRDT